MSLFKILNSIIIIIFFVYVEINFNNQDKIDFLQKENYVISENDSSLIKRKDIALIFAVDDYSNGFEPLKNPINDAKALEKVLKEKYTFNEVELIENPTKSQILKKLREYSRKTYLDYDQLLIFFSGHGIEDQDYSDKGHIVPVDAYDDDVFSCIMLNDIMDRVNAIPSPHILFIVDACFSGKMQNYGAVSRADSNFDFGGILYRNKTREEYISTVLNKKSRIFLASGDDKVPDGVSGKHSPFMNKLLETLNQNQDSVAINYIDAIYRKLQFVAASEPIIGNFGDSKPGSTFLFFSDY